MTIGHGEDTMPDTHEHMIDRYGRRLNYLRVSITDRCNLRCVYCMPPDGIEKVAHAQVLTYEELIRLARIMVGLGVEKIRLTGGEPLVRHDVYRFLDDLSAIDGLTDVSLTTNGVFLEDNLDRIRRAGVTRLNLSLDTLDRSKFKRITGFDAYDRVWDGLQSALRMGFAPIKINVVVIRGLNDDEVPDLARLSLEAPVHVRFIEYMPTDITPENLSLGHVPTGELKERLAVLGPLIRVPRDANGGPAERFRIEGAPGEIGFISALTNHFCPTCNRLRLKATGHLRPCLLSDMEFDLKTPLRAGASDEEMARLIREAAHSKPHAHHLLSEEHVSLSGRMSSIGG